jgi:hypothetical protein
MASSLNDALSLEACWRSLSSLCFHDDYHARYHDTRHQMRRSIIHRLSSPARAELIPTFGLLRVEDIRCSSRPAGTAGTDGLTVFAIDHCGNGVVRSEEVLGITHHRQDALDRTCCVSFSLDLPPRLRHLLLCASRCRSVLLPRGLTYGSYWSLSALVSMVSTITTITHHIHYVHQVALPQLCTFLESDLDLR